MAEIYLVRHGQASFNSDNYDQLSDLGYEQSEYLGQYFNDRGIIFDHIFTGSQQRHNQTANSILDNATNSYTVHTGLNEYDFAALYKAYMAQHPEEDEVVKSGDRRIYYHRLKLALTLWSEGKLVGDLPESWAAFKARVIEALNHINDSSQGKCLVVSSGGTISMAMGHILGLEPEKIIALNLQIKNTSFSHIYLGRNSMQLSSFNNIPHLDRRDRLDAITFS